MVNLGIIEPSTSEYCSPCVLVKKKDGSIRFCVDYRELNKLTKVDPFPMSDIDNCIEKISQSHFITILDFNKRVLADTSWEK